MSFPFNRLTTTLTLCAALATSAFAATNPRVTAKPEVRIAGKVDVASISTVTGSLSPKVAMATETGRLAGSTQLTHMLLVLKSSDAQEAALQGLLDQQQDRGANNFHQWMTPDTFGTYFGVAQADIAKVSAWLGDSGLSVDSVSPGGRIITFSGTASAVEKTFSTEIHTYLLNGETRYANSTEISLPSALTPVVAGVSRLNNFSVKTSAVNPHPLVRGTDGQFYPVVPGTKDTPDYTSTSSGSHYVGPMDVATIFNATPLLSAGVTGTGVTIGVIGQSSINLSNVETFRSLFLLPSNDPQIINVGPAPTIIGDDIESDLDVEWAGALASKATVLFATSGGSLYDGGVDTSALYLVDQNRADIISLSYGGCEVSNGSGGTAYWNTLWEQAAAQGQTVFVSSGDSSATGCASSSAVTAGTGTAGAYGVNALGSSAYNVAVGGTGFNEGSTAFQTGPTVYWGPGGFQPYGTALSYIPETVWSEGAFDVISQGSGVAGGGGGVSVFTARPPWQTGVGISATADPAGPVYTASGAVPATQLHRLVPDVSLIAAGSHDGTIFCSEGVCRLNSDGTVAGIGVVGGTSVATPVMAGVQALINQKNGGRQGNADYYFYKLAAAEPSTAACASTLPPAATCNFHDIVSGDNYSPRTAAGKYNVATGTYSGTFGTDYIGFPATTGYDEATGLGSPNVTNLANNWSSVTFNSTTTTLALTPTSTVHGTTINATIKVAANSSTAPVPTGDTSITAVGQTTGIDGNVYKLSAGTATAALQQLPGGTYNVYAHYAGDSIDGASNSAPVSVTISKEPTAMFLTADYISTAGSVYSQPATFTYGLSIYLDTDVQGNSATGVTGTGVLNTGVPTGSISYVVTSGSTTLAPSTQPLDNFGTTYLEIAQALPNFLIPINYPAISPGTYNFTASYPGDNSFGPISASTSVVVVKASSTPAIRLTSADITSGANAIFNITVATSGGGVAPTGTITLTDSTTSTVLGTATLINGGVPVSTTLIKTPGAHTINATYSGDTNYNTTTSANVTVNVIAGTSAAVTLVATSTANPIQVLNTVTLTATVPTGSTGVVYFYDQSIYLGGANISTATLTATLNLATLTAGTHNITATYAGTATIAGGTSLAVPVVVTKNTPTISLTSQQANGVDSQVNMNAVLTLVPAAPNTAAGANPAPTGLISFYDGTNLLGTAAFTHTPNYYFYTAAFSAPALSAGTHSLTATYPGDANYGAATSPVPQTVVISKASTTTTISTTTTAIGAGQSFTITSTVTPIVTSTPATNPIPVGGTVSFLDGTTVIGTASVVNGVATTTVAAIPTPGTRTIVAMYSGDANYLTSNSATTVSIAVGLTKTTLTIANSGSAGAVTTSLIAKVTPLIANTPVLGGSVSFYNNGVLLVTLPIVGTTATATYSFPFTGFTATSFVAVYSGDQNYYTSTSNTVANPYFTIAVNPTALTIKEGTSGSVQVVATTYNGYAGTAPLSCSGLPANSYCTFSYTGATALPTSGSTFVLPGTNGAQAQQIALTITTLLPHSVSGVKSSGLLWLPALMLAGFLGLRRKQLTLRGRQMMVLAILLCGTLATTACGSLSMATPTGTSTVTVTANGIGTAPLSPNVQPTATIALTVQ